MDSHQLFKPPTRQWKTSGWIARLAIALLVLRIGNVSITAAEDDESKYSKEYSACMEKSGGVTSAMMECNGHELELQETKLNTAYRKLLGKLDGKQKQSLKEAQRAWLAWRRANADYYFDPDGGSSARLASSDVYLRTTAERAREIEGEIKSRE